MSTSLVLHKGAVEVERSKLAKIEAPPPSGRWVPLKHETVLTAVCSALAGYRIAKERHAVSRSGHRYFGVLDLDCPLVPGVSLAVGVRNSTDKSFPLGFCAGSRVFVCDNLAFSSELLVTRKHTLNGQKRFVHEISEAVTKLGQWKDVEANRIRQLQLTQVDQAKASLCVIKAHEQGIISAPLIGRVWKEIVSPSHQYEQPAGLTMFTVLQAFTTILSEKARRSPSDYATQTIRLNALLTPELSMGQAA